MVTSEWDETGGVTLINFTIGGVSYQAEQDMTWEEWCNSSYNTGGFYISRDIICTTDGGVVGDPISTAGVKPNVTIVANRGYNVAN